MEPFLLHIHILLVLSNLKSGCVKYNIIIIKLYITVHSNTEPSTVTTFPDYKGKTAGTVFLNMGNILLEVHH